MSQFVSPRCGIARFIVVWVTGIILASVMLSVGLLVSTSKLRTETTRIFSIMKNRQTTHLFELAILTADHDHSLWRISENQTYRNEQEISLHDADNLLGELAQTTDSQSETGLVNAVAQNYSVFRAETESPSPLPVLTAQSVFDRLLRSVHRHRSFQDARLKTTLIANQHMYRFVAAWSFVLILVTCGLVVAGSIALWGRVFRPVLSLIEATQQIGIGDFHVRAPVLRPDEMGSLSRTFNEMAEAIEEREKERLRFVATVAHDLRNPLVVVGGAAHLLRCKAPMLTADQKEHWLGTIEGNAKTLEGMITDLTDAVQAQTGSLTFNMREFDLVSLARKIVHAQSAAAQGHLVRYEGADNCRISGDHDRMERAISNIVSNAVKYSCAGCEVILRVEVSEHRAVLSVQDEGTGIAAADIPKLFRPFVRLDRTSRMAQGTGLGLSSVKKVVEAHKGTVRIQSELDVGTKVILELPIVGDLRQLAPELVPE